MKNPSRLLKALVAVAVSLLFVVAFVPKALAVVYVISNSGNTATLYAALHTTKNIGDGTGITQAELEGLTGALNLSSKNLKSIDGLQYCINVTDFILSGNPNLKDIASLDSATLDNLLSLNLSSTGVTALPQDLQMKNLTYLNLTSSSITDAGLSGISSSNLPKLTTLLLEACSNLTSIENLASDTISAPQIVSLYLDDSPVASLPSDMSRMPNLTYLSLNHSGVHNTTANKNAILTIPNVKKLTNGFILDISQTAITDVSFLTPAAAPGVTTLYWQDTPTLTQANFHSLSAMTQLTNLSMANDTSMGGTNALTIIGALPNLTSLGIPDCGISDISALSGLNLGVLNIGSNAIKDLSPLANMSGLSNLTANNNDISDLSPLNGKDTLLIIDVTQNYLDETDGSPDRTVLDAIAKRQYSTVHYHPQLQIAIHFVNNLNTDPAPADVSAYYEQNITLPVITTKPAIGATPLGWDTNNDGKAELAAGVPVPFTCPLPVAGNDITLNAIYSHIDVITAAGNAPLYNALVPAYIPNPSGTSGAITDIDLESLTGALNLGNKNLASVPGHETTTGIAGLQYCTNITSLDLSSNIDLKDIDAFNNHKMPKLETLYLNGCSNLAALPQHWDLPILTFLNISSTLINDSNLAPVALLPKLVTLDAENCTALHNFGAIDSMASLTMLDLMGTQLSDIPEDLSDMTNLQDLAIGGNAGGTKMNIASLSHLTSIKTLPKFNASDPAHPASLNVSNSDITDLSFLTSANAPGLKKIFWANNPTLTAANIATLSSLAPQLTYLDLNDDTGLGDSALTTIATMTNLDQLFLNTCGITDLSPNSVTIGSLTKLIVLELEHNSISNISALSGMVDMQQLYLDYNPVSDIHYISGMTKMTTFYATYTGINDISALVGKPLSDVNLAVCYLDPTPGSADMTVINGLIAAGCNVTYNDPVQITVSFYTDPAIFPDSPPADITVYYGQNFTLPVAHAKYGYAMTGWDTTNQDRNPPYQPDYPAGAVIPFTWNANALPILAVSATNGFPGTNANQVLFLAMNTSFDADHELSGLASTTALSPAFDPQVSNYTISLPSSIQSVTLTPTVTAAGTTFKINGESVASKTISVDFGKTVNVVISVHFDKTNDMQYFVEITRAPAATTSTLGGIAVDSGLALTPGFTAANLSYSVSLPHDTSSVTITPQAANDATFKINNVSVASKTFSVPNGQTVPVSIEVTAQDGIGKTTYTVSLVRAPLYSDSQLSGITLTPATAAILPAFNPSTLHYAVTLPTAVASTTLAAQLPATCKMKIDGVAAASKTVSLYYGQSQTVSIVVTAENGINTTTYTFAFTRALPDASRLLQLGNGAGTLSPVFDPYKTSYTLTLPETTASVKLTPVKVSATAKVYFNGSLAASKSVAVAAGKSTSVAVKVVSAGNATTTYTVLIKRNASTNAALKSLTAAGATLAPAFKATMTAYTVTLKEAKSSVTIKAAIADANPTMTIDGKKVTSKNYTLNYGQTKIVTIVVKAQAGNTKTYKLTISRPPHVSSFKGTPKVSGYPTVKAGAPLTFTYQFASYGAVKTKIEVLRSGAYVKLLERTENAGTKKYVWDGKAGGAMLAPGKYTVRVSVTFAGLTSIKTLVVVVK